MSENPHFEWPATWEAARAFVTFEPRRPSETLGQELQSLAVFVRDHRMRELPKGDRSLEAHYGTFSLSQKRQPVEEAARQALEVRYGRAPIEARVLGRPARMYELGPEVPPDDIDGRSPAVVVWHDGGMFYLVASAELPAAELMRVAMSIHAPREG